MDQVNGVQSEIIKNILSAPAQNNLILLEVWEGQLLAHIRRFDVLYQKWRNHVVVAPILARPTEEVAHVL